MHMSCHAASMPDCCCKVIWWSPNAPNLSTTTQQAPIQPAQRVPTGLQLPDVSSPAHAPALHADAGRPAAAAGSGTVWRRRPGVWSLARPQEADAAAAHSRMDQAAVALCCRLGSTAADPAGSPAAATDQRAARTGVRGGASGCTYAAAGKLPSRHGHNDRSRKPRWRLCAAGAVELCSAAAGCSQGRTQAYSQPLR